LNYERFVGGALGRLETMLPADPKTPDLLVWVESLARESGIQLLAIDIANDDVQDNDIGANFAPGVAAAHPNLVKNEFTPDGNVVPRSVTISLRLAGGDYQVIKSFLNKLENSLRLMDVLSFSFSPTAQNYTMIIRAYYLE
jgi:hypothetical protein